MSKLPLERTDAPGIYRRGSNYVVVYRVEGRQRKQYASALAEARAIKLKRDGEARALRRGPTPVTFRLPTCARSEAAARFDVLEALFDRSVLLAAEAALFPGSS